VKHIALFALDFRPRLVLDVKVPLEDNLHLVVRVRVVQRRPGLEAVEARRDWGGRRAGVRQNSEASCQGRKTQGGFFLYGEARKREQVRRSNIPKIRILIRNQRRHKRRLRLREVLHGRHGARG
jgi:hypothetical protein